MININVATNVAVEPAKCFHDLMKYAESVASVEGKDLYKHVAKMSTAAGDLAATALDDFQASEDTYEEVADLMLRAGIFGLAHGMTADDLMLAIGRATERLVRDGLATRVQSVVEQSGFNHGGTIIIDPRH